METPSSAIGLSAKTPQERAIEDGFIAHEEWAFAAAYALFRRLLYGAAFGVLRDAADAEDCVHDVLTRLWQRGSTFTSARGSLQAFLCVSVRNEALTRRRTRLNRERIEREKLLAPAVQCAADDPAASRDELTASLQTLSEPQRQAIRLAYYEGYTHGEIAQMLNEPIGTVKSRLSSALRALRRTIPASDLP